MGITKKELFNVIDNSNITVQFTIGNSRGLIGFEDITVDYNSGEICGGNDFLNIDWDSAEIDEVDGEYRVSVPGMELTISVDED